MSIVVATKNMYWCVYIAIDVWSCMDMVLCTHVVQLLCYCYGHGHAVYKRSIGMRYAWHVHVSMSMSDLSIIDAHAHPTCMHMYAHVHVHVHVHVHASGTCMYAVVHVVLPCLHVCNGGSRLPRALAATSTYASHSRW